MSGMSRETFASELRDSFLGVWIDDLSGFGTFPIECMKSNTPVVGKTPRMIPEWMGETDENGTLNLKDNGVWTNNINSIPDIVATMVGLYLEGGIPQNITNGMEETASNYTMENLRKNVESTYTNIIGAREVELQTLLTNTEEVEATKTETTVTNE
jgi:hypothetical protein